MFLKEALVHARTRLDTYDYGRDVVHIKREALEELHRASVDFIKIKFALAGEAESNSKRAGYEELSQLRDRVGKIERDLQSYFMLDKHSRRELESIVRAVKKARREWADATYDSKDEMCALACMIRRVRDLEAFAKLRGLDV